MTPPVRTVVLPPSYGVTSFFVASTNTRAWRARSRRESFAADFESGEVEQWETVVAEPYESVEPCEEKEKTELDEQELERE